MEEQQSLPPAPSLGSSLMNVFAAPSDAFANLNTTASKASLWILPLLATIVALILTMIVGYSNQSLRSQRLEVTRITLEQRVADGKMTQEQFDRTMSGMEKGGGVILAIQIVAVTIFLSLFFFISAFLLWLASKFILKIPAGYEKFLELSGIAGWIGILGILVQMLLMVGLDSIFAQPSPVIFFYQSFDVTNSTHKALAILNFFSIWQAAVIGIGLQKWSNKSITMPMIVSFGVWILIAGLTLLMGVSA